MTNMSYDPETNCPRCKSDMVKTDEAGTIYYCGNCGWEPHLLKPKPHEAVEKLGRNELCPCGSLKKFKRCHQPIIDRMFADQHKQRMNPAPTPAPTTNTI